MYLQCNIEYLFEVKMFWTKVVDKNKIYFMPSVLFQ